MHTKGSCAALAIAGILFAVSPLVTRGINPTMYEGGRSRDVAQRAERNSSAIATMLGEIRTSTSDILFLKTERYLHSGVAYMPHMDTSLLTIEGETKEMDTHQQETAEQAAGEHHHHDDHAGTATVIRTRDKDFRGFIGTLQREVKPWRDPSLGHLHTDGTELLPWYRVMTLADPHNVRGYIVAGYWLKSQDIDEGIKFLREGMENNPDSFQPPYMLSRLMIEKAQHDGDAQEAAELRAEALKLNVQAAELALKARPEGWTEETQSAEWTHYTEDDMRGTLRLAVLLESRYGDPDKAVARAQDYLRRLGGDPILARYLRRAGAGDQP